MPIYIFISVLWHFVFIIIVVCLNCGISWYVLRNLRTVFSVILHVFGMHD